MNNKEKQSSDKQITAKALTLYDKDFAEINEGEETIELLIFRLSNEWYAVELGAIKEIVRMSNITYLPLSPTHIAGIINLRGRILSVTDLKKLFDLAQEEITEETRLIVVEHGNMETGLMADEVTSVTKVLKRKVDPPINTISSNIKEYIKGEIKIGSKFIVQLNTDLILKKEKN